LGLVLLDVADGIGDAMELEKGLGGGDVTDKGICTGVYMW
jgi:hypothetical protein